MYWTTLVMGIKFVSMPDLCEQYVTALSEQGLRLSDTRSYRADCLKLRLLQPLGESRWCSFGGQSE